MTRRYDAEMTGLVPAFDAPASGLKSAQHWFNQI